MPEIEKEGTSPDRILQLVVGRWQDFSSGRSAMRSSSISVLLTGCSSGCPAALARLDEAFFARYSSRRRLLLRWRELSNAWGRVLPEGFVAPLELQRMLTYTPLAVFSHLQAGSPKPSPRRKTEAIASGTSIKTMFQVRNVQTGACNRLSTSGKIHSLSSGVDSSLPQPISKEDVVRSDEDRRPRSPKLSRHFCFSRRGHGVTTEWIIYTKSKTSFKRRKSHRLPVNTSTLAAQTFQKFWSLHRCQYYCRMFFDMSIARPSYRNVSQFPWKTDAILAFSQAALRRTFEPP